MEPTYFDHKVNLLVHMRDLWYEASDTNEVEDVNLDIASNLVGVPASPVSGLLKELLALKFVAAKGATHLAYMDGRCHITTEGLVFLHQHEASRQAPEVKTKWRTPGFDLRG